MKITVHRTARPPARAARTSLCPVGAVAQEPGEAAPAVARRVQLRRPRRFRVVLHNDDYTTMEFVVSVLQSIFDHPPGAAYDLMLRVHNDGSAVAGVYPRDVAETKTAEAQSAAEQAGMPLLTTCEPED